MTILVIQLFVVQSTVPLSLDEEVTTIANQENLNTTEGFLPIKAHKILSTIKNIFINPYAIVIMIVVGICLIWAFAGHRGIEKVTNFIKTVKSGSETPEPGSAAPFISINISEPHSDDGIPFSKYTRMRATPKATKKINSNRKL